MRPAMPIEDRFWPKVDRSGGEDSCWLWTAQVTTSGYGGFTHSAERPVYAHRLAYELNSGNPIPPGMQIDHLCHVLLCVNPAHLRCTTPKQNVENHGGLQSNNKSGVRGVYWSANAKRWVGQVTHYRKVYHAGTFTDLDDAAEAVRVLRNSLHSHNDKDRASGQDGPAVEYLTWKGVAKWDRGPDFQVLWQASAPERDYLIARKGSAEFRFSEWELYFRYPDGTEELFTRSHTLRDAKRAALFEHRRLAGMVIANARSGE